jgi:hypothetical protein
VGPLESCLRAAADSHHPYTRGPAYLVLIFFWFLGPKGRQVRRMVYTTAFSKAELYSFDPSPASISLSPRSHSSYGPCAPSKRTRLGVSGTPGILFASSCETTSALFPCVRWDLPHQQGSRNRWGPLHTTYGISLESFGLNGARIHPMLEFSQLNTMSGFFGGLHLAAPTKIGGQAV